MSTTELTEIDEVEYLRGHTDGCVWAREYATPKELHDVTAYAAQGRISDPYWRGFAAGVEEIGEDGL